MQHGHLATPFAILLGFGLVSLTVWRGGVRIAEAIVASRSTSLVAPLPTVVAAPARSITSDSTNGQTPASPTPTSQDQELLVRDQAQDALGAQREEYRRLCAKRIPAQNPPEHGMFAVELGFDASGLEVSRTVRTGDPRPAPNWLACASAQKLPPLRVASIGRATTVTVQLTLP